MVQAVKHSCEAAGLQPVPALVDKCLQLQATLAVRFGVMLVGPSGEHLWPHAPCTISSPSYDSVGDSCVYYAHPLFPACCV